jgi:hypothetical protein
MTAGYSLFLVSYALPPIVGGFFCEKLPTDAIGAYVNARFGAAKVYLLKRLPCHAIETNLPSK